MAALRRQEKPTELYARLYSYYRHSFPAAHGANIPSFFASGFDKRFGEGVLGCIFCPFTTHCTIAPAIVDRFHYQSSPSCQLLRVDDSPLNDILLRLRLELESGTSSTQFLFEDDFLRCSSVDPDFRELSFAYGQWAWRSQLAVARLARNGFYYAVKKQAARCLSCLLTIQNPMTLRNLEEWHCANSPGCRYVLRATTDTWERLAFRHDPSGHIIEEHEECEVLAVIPDQRTARVRNIHTGVPSSPPHPVKRAAVEPVAKNAIPLPQSASGLPRLFHILSTLGWSDGALRSAILKKPTLITCTSSAAFLQAVEETVNRPAQSTTASETTMRSGNFSTIIDAKCELCVSAPKDAAFLPCGHVYGCLACCHRIWAGATANERRCCVCRIVVTGVLPLLLTYAITDY